MDRKFYLWAKKALSISCIEMKKIRYELGKYTIDTSDVPTIINSIVSSDSIDEKTKRKFKKKEYSYDYIRDEIRELNSRSIGFITIDDDLYPQRLKEIYDPPYILFYIGNIDLIGNKNMIAVVGSRKASDYGKSVSKKIVSDLASSGFVIISGMATGVDSYAHIYCMESGRPTLAVLGTGIDKVYPKKNFKLRNEIIESKGLIISEYSYDSITKPVNFAFRNRIISGLSSGVIVIEAMKKSGTMITVDTALQEGRNVYAVPGSIFSPLSQGCNNLIKQGAKPVSSAEDILEDFDMAYKEKSIEKFEKNKENEKNIDKNDKSTSNSYHTCDNIMTDGVEINSNSNKELMILNLLKTEGALDLDHIQAMTGYDTSTVAALINKLYLMGQVVEINPSVYAKF